jgi:Binding-protein-dependent transport system inner membrane component
MRNSFSSLPRELEEAALVDGTTAWEALFRVMLLLVVPGMATVLIFTILNAWNEFLAALIFVSDQDKFTLPVMLLSARTGEMGTVGLGRPAGRRHRHRRPERYTVPRLAALLHRRHGQRGRQGVRTQEPDQR